MLRWTGIVLGPRSTSGDEMDSRLPALLHPVAGRPLIWHAASALAALSPPPQRILVAVEQEMGPEQFSEVGVEVRVIQAGDASRKEIRRAARELTDTVLVLNAAAVPETATLQPLLAGPPGGWMADESGRNVAAAWLSTSQLPQLLRLAVPLVAPNGVLSAHTRAGEPQLVVRDRAQLAAAARRVRDLLVARLMRGGATFLLPETVLVDVDVRIGKDTVVYPGVVLEGQTSIGEETVVGPGCRIIDSWVGSGVELKGWNYLSHTSIRNRAILEPYVRRGFD